MFKRIKYLLGFPCVVRINEIYYVIKKPLFRSPLFLSSKDTADFTMSGGAAQFSTKEAAYARLNKYKGVLV
jgi:hypothetical protein